MFACTLVQMWRSENNFVDLVSSAHLDMDSRKRSRSPVSPDKYLESRAVMLFLIIYVVKNKNKQTKILDLLNVK